MRTLPTRSRSVYELCPPEWGRTPYRAIKTNIADSLNVVVHLDRRPGRYFSEVLVINCYDPDADLFDYGAMFLAKQDHP